MWLEMLNSFYFSQLKIGLKGYPCFAANRCDSNVCSIFYSLRVCIKCWVGWAQPNTHPAAWSPPSLTRQGKKWTKARGLVYLDDNHWIGKAKAVVISQAEYGISSLLLSSRQMSSQFLANSTCNACSGGWTPSPQLAFFPPPCLELFFLRVEHFLVTLSLLCGFAMLSTLFPIPQPTHCWLCVGRVETWCCASTVQQEPKLWGVNPVIEFLKGKAQHHTGCCEEGLSSSQPDPVQQLKLVKLFRDKMNVNAINKCSRAFLAWMDSRYYRIILNSLMWSIS